MGIFQGNDGTTFYTEDSNLDDTIAQIQKMSKEREEANYYQSSSSTDEVVGWTQRFKNILKSIVNVRGSFVNMGPFERQKAITRHKELARTTRSTVERMSRLCNGIDISKENQNSDWIENYKYYKSALKYHEDAINKLTNTSWLGSIVNSVRLSFYISKARLEVAYRALGIRMAGTWAAGNPAILVEGQKYKGNTIISFSSKAKLGRRGNTASDITREYIDILKNGRYADIAYYTPENKFVSTRVDLREVILNQDLALPVDPPKRRWQSTEEFVNFITQRDRPNQYGNLVV